jgi:putative tryptophan/tyrosine transport system substrate-binding protein
VLFGEHIRRREFVTVFGGAAFIIPLAAPAQPMKTAKIGFLGVATAAGFASKVEGFRAGLRDLGYVEGKNIVIEFRWAEGRYERLPALAEELVRLKVDVLVTHATAGTCAAKQATTKIPIVIAAVADAVATGLVASIAKPGGNVTGSSFFGPELSAKRLDVLKEVFPQVRRVGVLINSNGLFQPALDAMERSAGLLDIELQKFAIREPGELAGAFQDMSKRRTEALVVVEDPMLLANSPAIAELAAAQHLPSFGFLEMAEAGGLVAYGASIVEMHRHAAVFVDKILKGADPGDLPVEQPTKFELIINLKTANALGLHMPPTLLARADEVIE